jgi:CO/xanthine dehydrogenase FAD-binding subunit
MRPSNYYRPKTIEEALQLLAQPGTVPLGGGTKLLAGDTAALAVVDLQALSLNQIQFDENKLHIGAMVRLVDWAVLLAASSDNQSPGELLQKTIQQAGPNTYRNAATAGGTVAARLPDSELLAAMLVLDATLLLQTPEPQTVPLVDYLAAEERPNGLITQIRLSWEAGQGGSERVARTPADYPIVSVTAWQPHQSTPHLAATGIDARPVRLEESEAALVNGQTVQALEAAAAAAAKRTRHPGDFRGDASYRSQMAAILTHRLLSQSPKR